jgi:hypothetical protein
VAKLKSSLRMFYGRHHDLVNRYEKYVSQRGRICSVCCFFISNILLIIHIIPIKKGGKREKKLFLYDPAINIHIISYLLTKKKKRKGKIFFVLFVPFPPLFNRYDMIWNSQIMALYLSYYYL